MEVVCSPIDSPVFTFNNISKIEPVFHRWRQGIRVFDLNIDGKKDLINGSETGEVYFHENSVVGEVLSDLAVGTEVRFVLAEGEGEAGPQALYLAAHPDRDGKGNAHRRLDRAVELGDGQDLADGCVVAFAPEL